MYGTDKMNSTASFPKGEHIRRIALVLQGDRALGAYQAGVYQALHERGFAPDWAAGTSIGAVHIMASGALPSGFPPVPVEGEL
jgi:predicted acylesterase/phospholipase RssA